MIAASQRFGLRAADSASDIRRDRRSQDAVAMHVLGERIERALGARALHADQRHLALELDPRLGDRRHPAELAPRGGQLLLRMHDALTAPVVTHATSLEHDGPAEASRRSRVGAPSRRPRTRPSECRVSGTESFPRAGPARPRPRAAAETRRCSRAAPRAARRRRSRSRASRRRRRRRASRARAGSSSAPCTDGATCAPGASAVRSSTRTVDAERVARRARACGRAGRRRRCLRGV